MTVCCKKVVMKLLPTSAPKMVTRKSLLLKQVLYVATSYALFIAYGLDIISAVVFLALLATFYLRLFDVLHQKAHANNAMGLKPRWLDQAADYFNIYFLPYHEPPGGKLRKHMAHHQGHQRGDGYRLDPTRNPHVMFENGSFLKTLTAAFFYEETMLYFDIRHKNLRAERLLSMMIGLAVMTLEIYAFGIEKFLVFAIFYRGAFGLSWWGFSYVFHHPKVFGRQIDRQAHAKLLKSFQFIVGAGAVNSILFHEAHHLHPNVNGAELHFSEYEPRRA